ncbi:MAG: ATP phosphoribosyltransferase regulatory subunit [Halioglobus sp.]|jgi:ATP phosphoribosyltransferase regulatory subunit
MTNIDRWQLPDGVEEVLPTQAAGLERLRRQLLDLYRSWGYQLVIPPLMEFTESLLIGMGADIDLLTFKMTDQLSGRTLGIRADITPQVARIDAHSLAQEGTSRLCYAGSTLNTRPKTLMASRTPIQLGAELYGDESLAADLEIIRLMLETLHVAGLKKLSLDLGHVGVYKAVISEAGLDEEQERTVFDALQRKSVPDLEVALIDAAPEFRQLIIALAGLHGPEQVLDEARGLLGHRAPAAIAAIDTLADAAAEIRALHPELNIYFDLSELRGYHYHTGIVFAAYVPGHGQALANGGRYNDVGAVFGRARPATGFATDLKALMNLLPAQPQEPAAISAPDCTSSQPGLREKVNELRGQGEIVISTLAAQADPRCNRELVLSSGEWNVQKI